MSEPATPRGQGLIAKYLQQILIVAIISGGGYMFSWIVSLDRGSTDKDKEIIQLKDANRDMREDLEDLIDKYEDLKRFVEENKDNTSVRITRLEDANNCKSK